MMEANLTLIKFLLHVSIFIMDSSSSHEFNSMDSEFVAIGSFGFDHLFSHFCSASRTKEEHIMHKKRTYIWRTGMRPRLHAPRVVYKEPRRFKGNGDDLDMSSTLWERFIHIHVRCQKIIWPCTCWMHVTKMSESLYFSFDIQVARSANIQIQKA